MKTYIAKLERLEERCSYLQRGHMLLRQQRDDARKKSHNEKRGMTIQDQVQDIVKLYQTQSEKLDLVLEERNKK